MLRVTRFLQKGSQRLESVRLVKNKIPSYVTFLSKYLSVPIELNEDKYITQEEDRKNKKRIYAWTKHPYINAWLSPHGERQDGISFRYPFQYYASRYSK